jgi:hypothetical protein
MAENSSVNESIKIGSYRLPLPRSRILRIMIGVVLIIFGLFGFLPILGFWMVPLGMLVLSVDIPRVRRWRRRFAVWFHRRYPRLAAKLNPGGPANGNGAENGGPERTVVAATTDPKPLKPLA